MAQYKDREHFIPLRLSELAELLGCDETLTVEQRDQFQKFVRLVTATFHFEYHRHLEKLKDAYAPFDPDADTKLLTPLDPEAKRQRLDGLFNEFNWLLERANFTHLTRADIQEATEGATDWGLNMDVDFDVFERIEVYARGDMASIRSRRRWRKLFRLEQVEVPSFQRLVLIVKQRPHKRLGPAADTENVFLKIFKDVPKLDMEMLFPGARLQMPQIQRVKLGGSLLSSVGYVIYKIAAEVGQLAHAFVEKNPLAFWAPLSLVCGYGYKQYYGYQQTVQTYSYQLTQSLYYQNLDNNAGVLYRLLNEAEEQECREALLGYFYLWHRAGDAGWTSRELDDFVEAELDRRAGVKIDFEIGDALAKLERLRVVEKVGDRYRARPIDEALAVLDWSWDNAFQYAPPARARSA